VSVRTRDNRDEVNKTRGFRGLYINFVVTGRNSTFRNYLFRTLNCTKVPRYETFSFQDLFRFS
jgi:hypothetical protein